MKINTQDNLPLIMGIVNLTPDSFFSNSRKDSSVRCDDLEYKYADIIDVGCESSRPGACQINEQKELSRLAHFLENESISTKTLSIDTYKPAVARFA